MKKYLIKTNKEPNMPMFVRRVNKDGKLEYTSYHEYAHEYPNLDRARKVMDKHIDEELELYPLTIYTQDDLFDLNTYQELAARTANSNFSEKMTLANFGMGISGESGELTDMLKKHVFHGHSLDETKVAKEIGDVMWYASNIASLLGLTLNDIAAMNVKKLEERYPNGFNEEDSKNRKEYQK